MSPAATYAIRVAGHLDDHWASRLGGVDLVRDGDGTTTVTLDRADQAQLHGVLAGLRDIGAVVTELRSTAAAADVRRCALDGPLHTERLTLRPANADDAVTTWSYRKLDSVNEWLTGSPRDLASYGTLFTEPGRLRTAVIATLGHAPDGPVIGDFMLRRHDAWAQLEVAGQARDADVELGWALDPEHTGQGYATEAVRELIRYCFEVLGVHRVTATCFSANDASRRLMERVGMRQELHAVRDSLHRSAGWLDAVGYALLADEWRPARTTRQPLPLS